MSVEVGGFAGEHWRSALRVRRFTVYGEEFPAGRDFLAVWLEAAAEEAVDACWRSSPGAGFAGHLRAVGLCRGVLRKYMPEAALGCLPFPRLGPELRRALADEGLCAARDEGAVLKRRYALLTFYPFRGDCAGCALRPGCPRGGRIYESELA